MEFVLVLIISLVTLKFLISPFLNYIFPGKSLNKNIVIFISFSVIFISLFSVFDLNYPQNEKQENKITVKKNLNEVEIDRILKRIEILPDTLFKEKYDLYSILAKHYPENKLYTIKMKEFEKKMLDKEAKINFEDTLFGNKPTKSLWDGSYLEIKRYLKNNMHNPDSLEFITCTDVYRLKNRGWLIGCRYRGENAFGTKVVNAKWFTIQRSSVVNVDDISKYKW